MPGVDHGQILLEEMVDTINKGILGNISFCAGVHPVLQFQLQK